MRAGPAAVCEGEVRHRRARPTEHAFRYRSSQIWIDPDRPEELFDRSLLWSDRRPAVVRFRADDYGHRGSTEPLGEQARSDLESLLGRRPLGAVRMLSQARRWGWLFNPITIFVVWDAQPDQPVGAVLEVTNTPWKERHRYPIALTLDGGRFVARFPKQLHVSPFLDEDHHYLLRLDDRDDRVRLALDVEDGDGGTVLETFLDVERRKATAGSLAWSALTMFAPTHRVSLGIHVQAARLWLKGVPFVPHPRSRRTPERVS